ncbi:MAG: CHAT domain-containing protein [Singulisphaera sp.]
MNLETRMRAADRRAVALGLPGGAALVEFLRFEVHDFLAVPARGQPTWKPARYLAFVMSAGEPDDVRMVDLGEAEPIDRLIADYRAAITGEAASRDMVKGPVSPARATEAGVGSALRVAVFDGLTPALRGSTRLLLAPDGDLARLPFESLPRDDGRCLIDDYVISYLGCGRDVLRFGLVSTARPAEALVIADPDFDLEANGVPRQPHPTAGPSPAPRRAGFWSRLIRRGRKPIRAEAQQATPQVPPGPSLGRRSRDMGRDRFHFDRLPGTRAEGERVAAMLGAQLWTGPDALEGRLKDGCRSPRILHLATHGFFLPDQQADPDRASRHCVTPGGPGRLMGPLPENPLLRSGLALAGANTWLRSGNPPPDAEDGLLTAEDVCGLDLLDTDLAVLSACGTGLGVIRTGEGVFGLRALHAGRGQDARHEPLGGAGRADAGAHGGLLSPHPGRPAACGCPPGGATGAENPTSRPLLLGRLHLPGRPFTHRYPRTCGNAEAGCRLLDGENSNVKTRITVGLRCSPLLRPELRTSMKGAIGRSGTGQTTIHAGSPPLPW